MKKNDKTQEISKPIKLAKKTIKNLTVQTHVRAGMLPPTRITHVCSECG